VQSDRKLLLESLEILDTALAMARDAHPAFLLVCGDLTKDGERESHRLVASRLEDLARSGIKVYVVPGNHDVLNPSASGYGPRGAVPVANVTRALFAEIYRACGYGDALYRDPGSLSYVAEPVPGLWLLAIDSASDDHNAGRRRPVTGGGVTRARLSWIESMLLEAERRGKAVMAMMHHGVMEHYAGNERYLPQYLVNDWREMSALLAAWHVRVVFTGHNHAQDIAMESWPGGSVLYDVETGSTVTWPDPVRTVQIGPSQEMRITSSFITALPSFSARGVDFRDYSREFARTAAHSAALSTLERFGVSRADALLLAGQAADALLAAERGDESSTEPRALGGPHLGLMGSLAVSAARPLVQGLWNDVPPPDNDLTIDLAAGQWSP
jgi:predicted phosphodiesterase